MMGNVEQSLADLDHALTSTGLRGLDRLYVALCKAELLATDDREAQALEVFRAEIDFALGGVAPAYALVIADNRHNVSTFLENTSSRDFYLTVDARRVAGVDLWDSAALLEASDAAVEEKHFDALPLIWGECLRAYRTGSWRAQVVTARHMARECLRIGALDEAAFQAALGEEGKIAESIGDELFKRREIEMVEKTVTKLLDSANLAKHALVASKLFARIADLIPEARVETVFSWLLARSVTSPDDWPKSNSLKAAWEALHALAPRLDAAQSARLMDAAVSHQVWRTPQSVQREIMIESVRRVVPRLDADTLRRLATAVVPVVTDLRHDRDYVEAINLICRMVDFVSGEERAALARALYPDDGKRPNVVLLQVAEHLGYAPNGAMLASFIEEWTAYIRRQVERIPLDTEPVAIPGMFGHVVVPRGDHKIVVHELAGLAFGAIVRLRHAFAAPALESWVDALLAMIEEPENFLRNKTLLVDCLGDLADCLSATARARVEEVIAPLATAAPIQEPTVVQTAADVNHPLNRFRHQRGKPGELRRAALAALAKIESAHAGAVGRFHETIAEALVAGDVETRRAGFAAAQELPTVSRPLLTALLMGTRDGDREICVRAIHALASARDLELSESEWQLLFHSLRLAALSTERAVRQAVARSLIKLEISLPDSLQSDLRSFKEALRVDISYSVRRAFDDA